MLGSAKTILMIGDEALSIYSSGFKGLELVETVPWNAENFEENAAKIIAKDCSGRPVTVLNDMVEQHYRKERVPKVNAMDRKNVVKRKLNVAFPNYPVRAAFPLKEKIPKTDKAPAANVYIFAAAPQSEQYIKTMEAAKRSLAPISGYALLPVEAANMVKVLSGKLTPRSRPKSKWAVFIGQHINGGLRQVVIKDGELALTRMTPVVDSDADPDLWAHEVHQEFQATLSYMARFGFVADDGLDIIAVSNPAAGDILGGIIDVTAHVYTMTASEVAKKLGLSISSYADQRYADILHAAWSAKKPKLQLPMQAKELDSISKPRQVATLLSIGLIGGFAYLAYESFTTFDTLMQTNESISDARNRTARLNKEYQIEVEKKEALGFDVRMVQSSIAVQDRLDADNIDVLNVLKGIGQGLGRDLRLDTVDVRRLTRQDTNAAARFLRGDFSNNPNADKQVYVVRIQLTFPSTTDIDRGNQEIEALKNRIQKQLPNHSVEVEKYLKDTEYVDELVMGEDGQTKQDVAQDFIISLVIQGANS
tara:strand:- start:8508 stop:10112 length:1605 start_codon:yes stop_codon:yes gene_type:complete